MFDYNVMKKHGLGLSALPEGIIVMNKPSPFRSVHINLILIILGSLIFLLSFSFVLLFNIIKRRKAERLLIKEREELKGTLGKERILLDIAVFVNSVKPSERSIVKDALRRIVAAVNITGLS